MVSNIKIFVFLIILTCPLVLNSEELKDVLKDAYNYFPDIEKSRTELRISKKDLKISKTDFLPSLDFSASQGREVSKSHPDTSRINDNTINPASFDIDLTQPLGYTKVINLQQAKNNLKIAELSFFSTTQEVLLKASKAYYTVLKDHFLLDVTVRNEGNLKKNLKQLKKDLNLEMLLKLMFFKQKQGLLKLFLKE